MYFKKHLRIYNQVLHKQASTAYSRKIFIFTITFWQISWIYLKTLIP